MRVLKETPKILVTGDDSFAGRLIEPGLKLGAALGIYDPAKDSERFFSAMASGFGEKGKPVSTNQETAFKLNWNQEGQSDAVVKISGQIPVVDNWIVQRVMAGVSDKVLPTDAAATEMDALVKKLFKAFKEDYQKVCLNQGKPEACLPETQK